MEGVSGTRSVVLLLYRRGDFDVWQVTERQADVLAQEAALQSGWHALVEARTT